MLVLSSVSATALAAPPGQRVQRLVDNGNAERADIVCQKHIDSGAVRTDPIAMNLCADLKLAKLDRFSPGQEQLEEFAQYWVGTPARARVISRLWKQIDQRKHLEEVRLFARDWPAAPEVAQARLLERSLAYSQAQEADTDAGWRELLEYYPAHPRAQEAQGRWHRVVYRNAEKQNTRAAWEAFLTAWPQHPRRGEAEAHRIDAAYREVLQGGDSTELLALGDAFPHDSRAAFFRGIHTGLKLPVQAVHGHLTTAIGQPVIPLKTWQRRISIDTSQHPVSRVELMMIHKREKKPRPFADVWPALQAQEGISRVHKMTGPQMRWVKNENRLDGTLPWPLCQPSDADLAYGLAIHLAAVDKPTAAYAPLRFELGCAQLAARTKTLTGDIQTDTGVSFADGGLGSGGPPPANPQRVGTLLCSSVERDRFGGVSRCALSAAATVEGFQFARLSSIWFDADGRLVGARTFARHQIHGRPYPVGVFTFKDGGVTGFESQTGP